MSLSTTFLAADSVTRFPPVSALTLRVMRAVGNPLLVPPAAIHTMCFVLCKIVTCCMLYITYKQVI